MWTPFWFLPAYKTMARSYERVCEAHNRAHHIVGGNLTLIQQMLSEFHHWHPQRFLKPPSDALVIHLRLGDVIENNGAVIHIGIEGEGAPSKRQSVPQLLSEGGNPGHTNSYRASIKSVYEYLADIQTLSPGAINSIAIVGGAHFPQEYEKSRLYAGCLERALRAATSHTVTLHIGTDPDADFYFMAHARYVAVSAGGYSRLIGDLVEHLGGRIVGRSFPDAAEIKVAESESLRQKDVQGQQRQASWWGRFKYEFHNFLRSLVGK